MFYLKLYFKDILFFLCIINNNKLSFFIFTLKKILFFSIQGKLIKKRREK